MTEMFSRKDFMMLKNLLREDMETIIKEGVKDESSHFCGGSGYRNMKTPESTISM